MKGARAQQFTEVRTLQEVLIRHTGGIDCRLAIDAGANVGVWSAAMAPIFDRVIAFEPNAYTYAQLRQNTAKFAGVDARCAAVMDRPGRVRVFPPRPGKTSAGWQVEFDPAGVVDALAIDDLGLKSCGLIKLDLEGAELLALQGARKTIKRCKPVLIVEIGGLSERFGHSVSDVNDYILARGYRELFRSGVDRVFVPN